MSIVCTYNITCLLHPFFLFLRNIPKAIYISIPLVTMCYLLVNVAYLTIMSPDEIVRNEAVAVVSINTINTHHTHL